MDQRDSNTEIVLDDRSLDLYVQGRGLINFQFGSIINAEPSEDTQFIKFQGSKSKKPLCLYLLDFTSQSNAFSQRFADSCYDASDFCRQLHSVMENSSRALDTAIEDEDHGVVDIDTCPTIVDISTESASIDISTDSVEFDTSILTKELGLCNVDVKQLQLATTEKRVRPVDITYMQNIVEDSKRCIGGIQFEFPPAIGNVITDLCDLEVVKKRIAEGALHVEVIDGNHTTMAMKELNQMFPEEEQFMSRQVRLYHNLTTAEALKLGLKGNEMASHARPTSDFDVLKIIRCEMKRNFEGLATQAFRKHVNILLDIKKSDTSKQKRASEMIKLASMEDDCWAVLEDIAIKYPKQKIYIFNDVCHLSKEQALPLLTKIANGTIKPASLPFMAKSLPIPSPDTPQIVQIGKRKDKKEKANQSPVMVTCKTSPPTDLGKDSKAKRRIEELEREIILKNKKIQEQEFQIARERSETQHLREISKLKDQTIKILEEKNQVLKERLQIQDGEQKSRHIKVDSLPFKVSLPHVAGHASQGKRAVTQQPQPSPQQPEPSPQVSEKGTKRKKVQSQQSHINGNLTVKKKPTTVKDVRESSDTDREREFEIGERVWARYGEYKYPARITEKTDKTYSVIFDDDHKKKTFQRRSVASKLVRLTEETLKEAV